MHQTKSLLWLRTKIIISGTVLFLEFFFSYGLCITVHSRGTNRTTESGLSSGIRSLSAQSRPSGVPRSLPAVGLTVIYWLWHFYKWLRSFVGIGPRCARKHWCDIFCFPRFFLRPNGISVFSGTVLAQWATHGWKYRFFSCFTIYQWEKIPKNIENPLRFLVSNWYSVDMLFENISSRVSESSRKKSIEKRKQ